MQSGTLYRIFELLFNTEFDIDEKYRPIATGIIVLFSIIYSLAFLGLMQYVAYLGPGLGDNWDIAPYISVFQHFFTAAQGNLMDTQVMLFIGLTILNIIFTASIIFIGYWSYPKQIGRPFPITVLFTYLGLNIVCTLGILAIHVMTGAVSMLIGFDFMEGLEAFGNFLGYLKHWALSVPTLVDMPAWLAFFVLQMTGGFFHYWFHRLSHQSRVLWLLFHRTHHMTPELIQPSTQSVFNAFPFFFFAAVPYVVIFTVIGKLITAESLLIYLITYKLISAFANLFSHQTALYEWAHKKWYIRALSTLTSEGVYHYLHHSAEPEHNRKTGNLINVGGGLFFFWDRVFRTYRPVTPNKPRVGLQGIQPDEMSTNPIRLAIAGIAQLTYEFKNNRSLQNWLRIIFSTTDYTPEHSRDYALKARHCVN